MGKCYDIPIIEVHVSGGLVQSVNIPKGTNAQVLVKDYDQSDFITKDKLNDMKEDKNGKYNECVYESEE